jgi:hypothetical protein
VEALSTGSSARAMLRVADVLVISAALTTRH